LHGHAFVHSRQISDDWTYCEILTNIHTYVALRNKRIRPNILKLEDGIMLKELKAWHFFFFFFFFGATALFVPWPP
jgi:hypothetical protein